MIKTMLQRNMFCMMILFCLLGLAPLIPETAQAQQSIPMKTMVELERSFTLQISQKVDKFSQKYWDHRKQDFSGVERRTGERVNTLNAARARGASEEEMLRLEITYWRAKRQEMIHKLSTFEHQHALTWEGMKEDFWVGMYESLSYVFERIDWAEVFKPIIECVKEMNKDKCKDFHGMWRTFTIEAIEKTWKRKFVKKMVLYYQVTPEIAEDLWDSLVIPKLEKTPLQEMLEKGKDKFSEEGEKGLTDYLKKTVTPEIKAEKLVGKTQEEIKEYMEEETKKKAEERAKEIFAVPAFASDLFWKYVQILWGENMVAEHSRTINTYMSMCREAAGGDDPNKINYYYFNRGKLKEKLKELRGAKNGRDVVVKFPTWSSDNRHEGRDEEVRVATQNNFKDSLDRVAQGSRFNLGVYESIFNQAHEEFKAGNLNYGVFLAKVIDPLHNNVMSAYSQWLRLNQVDTEVSQRERDRIDRFLTEVIRVKDQVEQRGWELGTEIERINDRLEAMIIRLSERGRRLPSVKGELQELRYLARQGRQGEFYTKKNEILRTAEAVATILGEYNRLLEQHMTQYKAIAGAEENRAFFWQDGLFAPIRAFYAGGASAGAGRSSEPFVISESVKNYPATPPSLKDMLDLEIAEHELQKALMLKLTGTETGQSVPPAQEKTKAWSSISSNVYGGQVRGNLTELHARHDLVDRFIAMSVAKLRALDADLSSQADIDLRLLTGLRKAEYDLKHGRISVDAFDAQWNRIIEEFELARTEAAYPYELAMELSLFLDTLEGPGSAHAYEKKRYGGYGSTIIAGKQMNELSARQQKNLRDARALVDRVLGKTGRTLVSMDDVPRPGETPREDVQRLTRHWSILYDDDNCGVYFFNALHVELYTGDVTRRAPDDMLERRVRIIRDYYQKLSDTYRRNDPLLKRRCERVQRLNEHMDRLEHRFDAVIWAEAQQLSQSVVEPLRLACAPYGDVGGSAATHLHVPCDMLGAYDRVQSYIPPGGDVADGEGLFGLYLNHETVEQLRKIDWDKNSLKVLSPSANLSIRSGQVAPEFRRAREVRIRICPALTGSTPERQAYERCVNQENFTTVARNSFSFSHPFVMQRWMAYQLDMQVVLENGQTVIPKGYPVKFQWWPEDEDDDDNGKDEPPDREPDSTVFDKAHVIVCGTDKVFVRSLYHSVFEREPADSEVEVHVNMLRNGTLRWQVVRDFLLSTEYKSLGRSGGEFMTDACQAIYAREPTASERKAWPRTRRSIILDEMFKSQKHLDLTEGCAALWREAPADKKPPEKLSKLTGNWVGNNHIMSISQSGQNVTVTATENKGPVGWKTATGVLKGNTVDMNFDGHKLTGNISSQGNEILWSNGVTWIRDDSGLTTDDGTGGGLGKDITFNFETGRTNGWMKTGTAFNYQPTYGDNPTARHRGQPSKHIGNYWVGTFEKYQGSGSQTPGSVQGDGPKGTLTSNVFTIPSGSLSFLVGGGNSFQTRVELLVLGNRVLSVSGRGTETMHRVKWDLNPWAGQQGQIRLVDNASGGWGHINADDFRFSNSSSSGGTPGGIRIESATYGGNCGVAKGNVTAHIDKQCNGKSKCRYTVNYKIIGDPSPGCAKTYIVRYRCGNNPQVFEKSLTAEAGWGDKSVLLECADSLNGDIVKPDYTDGKVTSKCGLGKSWDVTEVYGWTGVWLRRGKSNVFDALWTLGGKQEKAVLTISINGNTVNVKRKQSAGYSYPGQECTYKGTLAADNVTVTGTYGCAWAAGPFNWRATIRCDSGGDGGAAQGTARLLTASSNRDMVGRNEKFRGNGKTDAIFRAQFSAPNRMVTAVEVSNTNGVRSVWDTRPNNRLWLGGVVIGGRTMNRSDGSVNFSLGSGQNTLDFFVEDNGSIRGGKTNYRMTIFFASGDPVVMNIISGGGGPGSSSSDTPTGSKHPLGDITKTTGTGPTGLTLDFETGNTNGWMKTGTAFNHQPTYGDNPTARHRGQPSKHVGNYWIGTYEKYQKHGSEKPGSVQGDGPIGTLTSNVFTIPTGSLSFLVGGGSSFQTRVELLVLGNRVLSVSGRGTETMHRVKWDLNPWAGQQGQIRLVDNASGGWGHINADDFRFSNSSSTGTPGGIRIESATYGGNCGVAKGNVTAHIDRQCNGKSKCRYTVNYKIIGDPAYGCAKTYTVRYRCGNNPQIFEKSLTAEAGWGDKSVLLECADSLNGDIVKPDYTDGKITSKCGLGKRWDENEVGWTGVWLRRGKSNVFDAQWTLGGRQEKAVLTISIHGNTVDVKRKQSAGYSYPGQECTYKGTLAADNVTVTGTYGCAWDAGPFNWRATIRCDSGGGNASTTGSLPPSQGIKKVITGYGKKK